MKSNEVVRTSPFKAGSTVDAAVALMMMEYTVPTGSDILSCRLSSGLIENLSCVLSLASRVMKDGMLVVAYVKETARLAGMMLATF